MRGQITVVHTHSLTFTIRYFPCNRHVSQTEPVHINIIPNSLSLSNFSSPSSTSKFNHLTNKKNLRRSELSYWCTAIQTLMPWAPELLSTHSLQNPTSQLIFPLGPEKVSGPISEPRPRFGSGSDCGLTHLGRTGAAFSVSRRGVRAGREVGKCGQMLSRSVWRSRTRFRKKWSLRMLLATSFWGRKIQRARFRGGKCFPKDGSSLFYASRLSFFVTWTE